MKLRIGLVMPQGQISGAERVLLELLEERPDMDITVFAPQDSPLAIELRRLDIHVCDFYVPKMMSCRSPLEYMRCLARALLALRRGVRSRKLQLLHAFLPLTFKVAVPIARVEGVPLVVSVHDITTPAAIGWMRSKVQRLLVASTARRIIVVSGYVAHALRESGYSEKRLVVIHNGVRVRDESTNVSRAALGLEPASLTFGVVGRITPWKGQAVALDAFVLAQKLLSNRNLQLFFLGGPFEDGDEDFLAFLKAKVRTNDLVQTVHFLGHRDDPWPVYGAADAILVPSTRPDPFPTVVLEAGAAGRPVIVTDLGGGKEAVIDGMTGIVSRPDAHSFAQAMIRISDDGWRNDLGASAKAHISAEFRRTEYAHRITNQWEEVLGEKEIRV